MNDPLDQAQALQAMDAVAGLFDFVNANGGAGGAPKEEW